MDKPDDNTSQEAPVMPTEAALRDMMRQNDDDVAAGLLYPVDDVLAELDAAIADMEAGRIARTG